VRVILHPDARAELRSAVLWYDEQREGLGTEFLIEVASALDRISAPESPRWTGLDDRLRAIRRHTMHRFRYLHVLGGQRDDPWTGMGRRADHESLSVLSALCASSRRCRSIRSHHPAST
jgi:hypothetical protein